MLSQDKLFKFRNAINLQIGIAEAWSSKANESHDVFSRFFFYYTGFNSIYYMWSLINEKGREKEFKQIEFLIRHLDDALVIEALGKLKPSIDYFLMRDPIQQMNKRDEGNPENGDLEKGKTFRKVLQASHEIGHKDRLNALAQILYLIRCNTFHGSKADSGDDQTVVGYAAPIAKILLEKSVEFLKSNT